MLALGRYVKEQSGAYEVTTFTWILGPQVLCSNGTLTLIIPISVYY